MRMFRIFCRKILTLGACVFIVCETGCSAPWSEVSTARAGAANETPLATPQAATSDAGTDLTSVLDKLQEIRQIDPAAEAKLIEQLRRTPAHSWPLVAEQFRASLAYREQLAARGAKTQPPSGSQHGPRAKPDRPATANTDKTSLSAFDTRGGAFAERKSTPIGSLPDPRRADKDDVAVAAQAAPYTMKVELPGAVPAEFVNDGQAQPIASGTTSSGTIPEVVQARLETVSEGAHEASSQSAEGTDWQLLVRQAAEELGRRVSPSPASTAEVHQHVSLRILRLLAGDTEKALDPIPHLGPAEQDYWSRQLFALATYLDHHAQPDDKRRAAASVAQLDEAVLHLREISPLVLRNLSFCKNVYGYGAIQPYDKQQFSPGEQVSLYVEVENYRSQSTEQGFRTLLASSYEVLDDKDKRVDGAEFPDVDDYCRNRRRDFHIQYGISLPQTIAPGRYRLNLVVKDRLSDKIGQGTAVFEIRERRP